jgi:hypothetical protein
VSATTEPILIVAGAGGAASTVEAINPKEIIAIPDTNIERAAQRFPLSMDTSFFRWSIWFLSFIWFIWFLWPLDPGYRPLSV